MSELGVERKRDLKEVLRAKVIENQSGDPEIDFGSLNIEIPYRGKLNWMLALI